MTGPVVKPVSFDIPGAALATGYSDDVIRRAIKAGDITARYPRVNGKQLSKPVIQHDELARWIAAGDTARKHT